MNGFESGNLRARWVYTLFGALAITTLLVIAFTFMDATLLWDLIDGRFVSDDKLNSSANRVALVSGVHILLTMCGTVAFLMWVHRAHKNLLALGARGLKFSPGWAVGWFFIPVLHLVYPYRVLSEIWRASDIDAGAEDGSTWRGDSYSKAVVVWWALFLAAFLARLIIAYNPVPEDPADVATLLELRAYWQEFLTSRYIEIGSGFVHVIGYLVTINLVWKIENRQRMRRDLVRGSLTSNTLNTLAVHEGIGVFGLRRGKSAGVSSGLVCPWCGASVSVNWRSCPFCARQLKGLGSSYCTQCGKRIDGDGGMCLNCSNSQQKT